MKVVLDACSVIAYARGEQGADVVEAYLLGDSSCWMHSINLCEVYYDFLRAGGLVSAEQVVADVRDFGVQIYSGADDPLWKVAASYKAALRRISLADCFAMALTNQLEGSLLTSDHKEFDPVVEQKLCRVEFIR